MTRLPTIVSLDREPTEADARRLSTRGRIARTTEDVGQPAGTMVGVVGEVDVVRAVRAVQQGWDLVVQLDLRGEHRRLVLEDLGRLGVLADERALDGRPALESIDDDLLRHLASGVTVHEAAQAVGMSDRSAARSLSRLREALGVATIAGLVGRWRSAP